MYIEDQDEQQLDQDLLLSRLSDAVLDLRDEAVEARAASGIERQWSEDQKMFDSIDNQNDRVSSLDAATGNLAGPKDRVGKRKSRVKTNIVRIKCEIAEGKFNEIALPIDEPNWGMKHTPVPDMPPHPPQQLQGLIGGAQQTESPLGAMPTSIQQPTPQQTPIQTMGQSDSAISPLGDQQGQSQPQQPAELPKPIDPAEQAATNMETEINDQLTECNFNSECRKAVRQAIKLGTGVLKGPNVIKKTKKSWHKIQEGMESVHVMQFKEERKPVSEYRDIWNIFPDPYWIGDDPDKLSYVWERDYVLGRELKKLIGLPGYSEKQILKILDEEPVRTKVALKDDKNQRVHAILKKGAPYERWEYHGEASRDLLEAMGCQCPPGAMSVSACIVFVNERPIKVHLNPLDDGAIPYDFFQWVQVDDSPWGIGEVRKLAWWQRIIEAGWRMMMDNSGDSAGANIVMNSDVEPEDGEWEFSGRKIWINEGDLPADQCFSQFQIENNQAEYERIIQLAVQFIDLESGTPQMMQGEKEAAPETFRGMELLMNSANGKFRRQVKQWDDQVTRPHITRYYDWNMAYNPKPEIKGDMNVDPRGVSTLLVRDQTVQDLLQIFQLRQDPEAAILVDWEKVIKQLFESKHLNVLKTDDEIAQAREQAKANPPMDPRVQAAQMKLQGEQQIEQLRQQSDMKEIEAKAKFNQDEIAAKLHMSQEEMQHEREMKQMELQVKMIELSQSQNISLEQIKANLAATTMKLNTQTNLSAASMEHDHARMLHQNLLKPVSNPPTEPAGKAPAGESYQR